MLAGSYGLCVIALLGMKLTKPDNTLALMFWDAWTNTMGALMPVFCLCICPDFCQGLGADAKEKHVALLSRCLPSLWCGPIRCTTCITGFSPPLEAEIVFGPYIAVTGLYSWLLPAGQPDADD